MYLIDCYKENSKVPIYVSQIRDVTSFIQCNLFFYDKIIIIDLDRIETEEIGNELSANLFNS